MMRKILDLIRPSSSHKWLNCLGSPYQEARFDDTTSEYAREGSLAHLIAQWCLTHGVIAEKYVGQGELPAEFDGLEVDADMASHVQRYVDYVIALPGQLFVEHVLPFKDLNVLPNNGISDAVVVDWDSAHAYVVDLKYGKGMQVDAEENTQLMLYALGTVLSLEMLGDIDTVKLVIHQPRLDRISEWTVTRKELEDFQTVVAAAVNAIGSPDYAKVAHEHLTPGPHCNKFCSALPTCEAAAKYNFELISGEFEEIKDIADAALHPVGELSLDDLNQVLRRGAEIKKWCDAVKAHVEDLIRRGVEVPGQKLVQGRSPGRKWRDIDEIETVLKRMRSLKESEYTKRTLLSVPALEKKLGKATFADKKLNDYVVKPEGAPALAVAEDPRPSISAIDGFEVIDEFELIGDEAETTGET